MTLAKSVTAVAIAKGAGGQRFNLNPRIKDYALKAMTWAKLKFACGFGAAILLAGSAVTVAVAEKGTTTLHSLNPVALLKKTVAAREKIKSGEMEFIVSLDMISNGISRQIMRC